MKLISDEIRWFDISYSSISTSMIILNTKFLNSYRPYHIEQIRGRIMSSISDIVKNMK